MYAIGSRQELEALTKQLAANIKVARGLLADDRVADCAEMLEINALYIGMLEQALRDHFNGKN